VSFPEAFRSSLERAEFGPLAGLYAPDATLEALLPGGRIVRRGSSEILATFQAWWPEPAEVVDWRTSTFATGLEIRAERTDAAIPCARHQAHHVHLSGDLVARQVVVPRRARVGVEFPPAVDGSLLARARARVPLLHEGVSGSLLERIVLDDGTPLVVKHVSRSLDWIARATDDPGREALLGLDGVFGRLPQGIDPAIVSVERADDGWRIFMRDVSDLLTPPGTRVSREDNRRMFELIAKMHRVFLGQRIDHLASAESHIVFLTPATAAREQGCETFLRVIERGAEVLPSLVEPDLVEVLFTVVAEPSGLAGELRACGTTLVHGDVRYANIGLRPGGMVLIDWGLATLAPPSVDLAFFLSSGLVDVEVDRRRALEDAREIWGDLIDDRSMALALLAEAVGTIWFEAMRIADHADERERARSADELSWWTARARDALEHHWAPGRG
jgi:hypothetical protein